MPHHARKVIISPDSSVKTYSSVENAPAGAGAETRRRTGSSNSFMGICRYVVSNSFTAKDQCSNESMLVGAEFMSNLGLI